jgi:hypothetical protein
MKIKKEEKQHSSSSSRKIIKNAYFFWSVKIPHSSNIIIGTQADGNRSWKANIVDKTT